MLLAGRPVPERDEAFGVWSEARRRRLSSAARRLDLDGLMTRCVGVTDPSLAPLLPVGFAARAAHRVAGGVLILTEKAWAFRPDSPWEVEEALELGLPTLDPRRCGATPDALWAALSPVDASTARIGVVGGAVEESRAGSAESSGRPSVERVVLPQDFVLDRLRMPSPMETGEVDRVCRANDLAMLAVARRLVEAVTVDGALWLGGHPLTIGRLRAAAVDAVQEAGLSFPEGCLVSAGASAASPHDQGDDHHRLAVGEAIVVDLFPRGALFSDMTRTFLPGIGLPGVGGPGTEAVPAGQQDDLVRALAAVEAALAVAEQSVRAELSSRIDGADAHRIQRRVQHHLADHGWPVPESSAPDAPPSNEGFVHGLGHGVGYRLHQPPWFSAEEAGTVRGEILAREAFTLEPGLYRPGAWGVRIEDVYRLEWRASSSAGSEQGSPARNATEALEEPLELVRLTQSPRCADPAQFLYESARLR